MSRLALVAGLLALGGCSGVDWPALADALARDQNQVCIHNELTTPWGHNATTIERNHGCSPP